MANIVSGTVLTYMYAFKIGDRVKIGDATGEVIEKTFLVTRIKTIKNLIITIPNSAVMSGHIINYSTSARKNEDRLVLHTTVTLGYDIPWRQVHKVLLSAAKRTERVLKSPAPYVLQTSLDDFYVSYELNAFIDQPEFMARVYSDLHQNIQDACNESGLEILSPHYRAMRDGQASTIPTGYLGEDYKPPAFVVRLVDRLRRFSGGAGQKNGFFAGSLKPPPGGIASVIPTTSAPGELHLRFLGIPAFKAT